tara:strand:+ start:285 stop:512 length:228 start_codon:yes stop_codon:yes gene_type:complete
MKKFFYQFIVLVFISAFVSSCSKCVDCSDCPDGITLTNASGEDVSSLEMCEEDFDSKEDYDQSVSLAEGLGCDCK